MEAGSHAFSHPFVWSPEDVSALKRSYLSLLDERDRLEKVAEAVKDNEFNSDGCCVECGSNSQDGHAKSCGLGAALRELEDHRSSSEEK